MLIAFVTVFDSGAVWRWARRLGSTSADYANAVSVDVAGNIMVAGKVSGAADMNGDASAAGGG
ncbi:MAG: hypothetical protein IT292_10155 [Deltaproteobacteria bacterium]|nr:hypothetical protein [Deltaproteobacteria bacterium]